MYQTLYAKLTLEIDQQFRSPPLLDRFCSCEFDYCSPGVDQRETTYHNLWVLTAGKICLLEKLIGETRPSLSLTNGRIHLVASGI